VLPIEHNLPLGCPGLQGFLLSGGTVVLGTSTRPRDVFELIQRHRVSHIHLVPALLIRWIDDPAIREWDLSSLKVILSHPAVLNVACVPYPDPVLGERMCDALPLSGFGKVSKKELAAQLAGDAS
jgi:non-ribosomal peptide synthetase component E (peptide arylation enzyme)